MSESIVILCPGQGAQRVGMGRAWAEASQRAAQVMRDADRILGNRFGKPLSAICYEGPEELLNRTEVAQPALLAVGVACWHACFTQEDRQRLAATAGLSLGEYTALYIAGAFSFQDALNLVALRGKAMQDAAEDTPSAMVALIGADAQQAESLCAHAAQGDVLVPANYNAPGQIVISGSLSACDRAVAHAPDLGLRATKLAVAGAFHSPLMAPAAQRLGQALEKVQITPTPPTGDRPTLSNVTGLPHESRGLSAHDASRKIRQRLVEQLTRPVQWQQSCAWLLANVTGEFHELAPGKVLAGLMRRIDRDTKVVSHDEPC